MPRSKASYNGNWTGWNSIRSLIIQVINKIRRTRSKSSICQLRVSLPERIGRLEVLLPINQNILERDWTFILKTTVKSAKCKTTARAHDALCTLTQACQVNCPFNCPIKLSNYKHDAYTVRQCSNRVGDNQSRSRILLWF